MSLLLLAQTPPNTTRTQRLEERLDSSSFHDRGSTRRAFDHTMEGTTLFFSRLRRHTSSKRVHKRLTSIFPSSKYQFMETQMQRKAAGLKEKIPDIEKTLETVRFLKSRKV